MNLGRPEKLERVNVVPRKRCLRCGEKVVRCDSWVACVGCDFRWDVDTVGMKYKDNWVDEWHEVPEGCVGVMGEVL